MARTEEGFTLYALLLLNHRGETQSDLLPHGCCGPGRIHRNCIVPGQHVKNSVKQTLTDQTYFYILSHLQTNSNSRKLGGFAFPMLGPLFSFQHSILHVGMTALGGTATRALISIIESWNIQISWNITSQKAGSPVHSNKEPPLLFHPNRKTFNSEIAQIGWVVCHSSACNPYIKPLSYQWWTHPAITVSL